MLPRDDCGATTPLDRGKEAREQRRPLTSEAVPESLKRKGWEGRQEVTQLWPLWGDRPAALTNLMVPPRFEINFLSETGDIVFHIKPRFSSATMVANAFQGGRWGQEEASSVFPLVLGEPLEVRCWG